MSCNNYSIIIPGIEVHYSDNVSDDGVEYLVKKHPEIEKFHLEYDYGDVSHVGLSSVLSLQYLSDLMVMKSIRSIPDINSIHDKVFKFKSKQLQTIYLYETGLTEINIISILENCKESLQNLKLSEITDIFCIQILQLCGSSLKSLDLGCTNITGENLSEYNGTLPYLKNLNLSCCELTDKDTTAMQEYT